MRCPQTIIRQPENVQWQPPSIIRCPRHPIIKQPKPPLSIEAARKHNNMKVNKKFKQMSMAEYRHYIAHHQKYADFNPLGLYRSILENDKLDEAAQLEILAFANQYFQRFYDFLFIKDPVAYSRLATLGQDLSETQQRQHLSRVWDRREQWCAEKAIRHISASAQAPFRAITLPMAMKPTAGAKCGT